MRLSPDELIFWQYGFIKLNATIVAALRSPEVQQKLTPVGAILIGDTPEEFRAYILAEEKKWAEVVRISGARIE